VMTKGLFDWTALHYAAYSGFAEACKLLVDSDQAVDINARSRDGQTALILAARNGHLAVTLYLIGLKADTSAADVFGQTALHYAKALKYAEIAMELVAYSPYLQLIERCTDWDNMTEPGDAQVLKTGSFLVQTAPSKVALRRNTYFQPSPTDPPSPFPTALKRYEPIALLGEGAFGQVYLARHSPSGDLRALKSVKKSLILPNQLLKYLITERRVLMAAQHPFIAQLYECFQTPSRLVLSMEYCAGSDLRSLLTCLGKLPESVVQLYAAEIFLALEYLHRNDIAYRDLKPENVVLDSKGHIRLVDFGLAKEGLGDHDETGSFCGSISYLAPEMIRESTHDKMVDWYQFGCLIYELLTGRPPYFAVELKDLLVLIEAGKVKYGGKITAAAQDLIQALLQSSPKERLGRGRKGRKSIKAHSFFKGVNWDLAVLRQLPVPAPPAPVLSSDPVYKWQVYGSVKADKRYQRVFGWSFLSAQF